MWEDGLELATTVNPNPLDAFTKIEYWATSKVNDYSLKEWVTAGISGAGGSPRPSGCDG